MGEHCCGGVISELRDGNHLLFMLMRPGIYSTFWNNKKCVNTVNCEPLKNTVCKDERDLVAHGSVKKGIF